eukprot:scaffold179_cov368-Prasinococcus_capsulatus_cf.AAC.24
MAQVGMRLTERTAEGGGRTAQRTTIGETGPGLVTFPKAQLVWSSTALCGGYKIRCRSWYDSGLPPKDNYMILVSFIWLTVGIFRVSSALQNQVALREERKPSTVLACLVLSSVHVALVYYGYRGEQLWRQLLLLPPATNLFFACLWRAAINDYLMRFLTVAVKSLLLLATKREPGRVNRRTATYMTAIEHSSLLYRSLLPMPVWYKFFLRDEVGQVFSSLVTGLYLTFKISAVFDRIAMTVAAMRVRSRVTSRGWVRDELNLAPPV